MQRLIAVYVTAPLGCQLGGAALHVHMDNHMGIRMDIHMGIHMDIHMAN